MQVEITPALIQKMRTLFTILETAHTEMGETSYPAIYFDSQESGDSNSDPQEFSTLTKETLDLAVQIKTSLRL